MKEINYDLMAVTVYTEKGIKILHNVIEVTKTADLKKYRIKQIISHGMGTDFQYYYYNSRTTEIHIS